VPGTNRREQGFLLTEMIVVAGIVTLLLSGLAMSLRGLAGFNRYQLTRQRCIAAAQAQLDSLGATGRPIPPGKIRQLWPDLSTTVAISPGSGQWDGLQLVTVTAVGKSFGRKVTVELARYVPGSAKQPSDATDQTPAGKGE